MPLQSPTTTVINAQLTGASLGAVNTINLSGTITGTVAGGVLTVSIPSYQVAIQGQADQNVPFWSGTVLTASTFEYDYVRGGIESSKPASYLALAPFTSGVFPQGGSEGTPPQEAGLGQAWFHTKTGRTLFNVQGPLGADQTMQVHFGQDRVIVHSANAAAATTNSIGDTPMTPSGAFAAATLAATNFSSSLRRVDQAVGATAGQAAGMYDATLKYWRGSSAGQGGWYQQTRLIIAATASFNATGITNTRFFCGMTTGTAAPPNTSPSGVWGTFGVALSADTASLPGSQKYFFLATTGSAPTVVDTGISMSLGDVLDVRTYCPPSGSVIYMSLQKLNPSGAPILAEWSVSGGMFNFPSNTQFFGYRHYIQTNTTSTCRYGFMNTYIDVDY